MLAMLSVTASIASMLGLLIVDHGSRRAEANAQLSMVAAQVASRAPQARVAYAHMELAEPSISAAFTTLATAGATEIVVLLYFLSGGRHATEDIPRLVGEAAQAHPQVRWRVAPALGPHEMLAELLLLRGEISARG